MTEKGPLVISIPDHYVTPVLTTATGIGITAIYGALDIMTDINVDSVGATGLGITGGGIIIAGLTKAFKLR